MSSTLRVVLWIVGGLAVLLILVMVAGRLWWRGNSAAFQQAMENGHAAGARLTARQCVDSVLHRHAAASDFGQSMPQSLFLGGCLQTARQLPALCAESPDQGIMASAQWTLRICHERGLSDRLCPTVLQPLLSACRQASRRGP